MNKTSVAAVAVLALSVAGVFGGWRLYQGHLSGDLRTTLEDALDLQCTTADTLAYIHAARLQVRTAKDRVVLDRVVLLAQLVAEDEDQYAKATPAAEPPVENMKEEVRLYESLRLDLDLPSE